MTYEPGLCCPSCGYKWSCPCKACIGSTKSKRDLRRGKSAGDKMRKFWWLEWSIYNNLFGNKLFDSSYIDVFNRDYSWGEDDDNSCCLMEQAYASKMGWDEEVNEKAL